MIQNVSLPGGERPPGRASSVNWSSLDSVLTGFAGADADHFAQRVYEDFAVADLARLGAAHDGVDHFLRIVIAGDDLELDLGDKVDGVFGAAVHFLVPFLATETADFRHRHAGDTLLG